MRTFEAFVIFSVVLLAGHRTLVTALPTFDYPWTGLRLERSSDSSDDCDRIDGFCVRARQQFPSGSEQSEIGLEAVDIPAAVYPHDTPSAPTATTRAAGVSVSSISPLPDPELRKRSPNARPDDLVKGIPSSIKEQESPAPRPTNPNVFLDCASGSMPCPPGYILYIVQGFCWCRLKGH